MSEELWTMIVQAVLSIGIVGAWLYTLVVNGESPEALSTAAMIILGFWFGTVTERVRQIIRTRRER